MNEEKKKKLVWPWAVAIVLVGIIITLVVLMTNSKTSYETGGNQITSIAALYCKASSPASPFFESPDAMSQLYEIKYTYRDKKVDKTSFTYTGTFSSDAAAKTAASTLHAKYNEYMYTTNSDPEDMSPNFSSIDNQLVITLFFTGKTFNADIAPIMFISSTDVSKIDSYSVNTLQKIYEARGFSCQYSE